MNSDKANASTSENGVSPENVAAHGSNDDPISKRNNRTYVIC